MLIDSLETARRKSVAARQALDLVATLPPVIGVDHGSKDGDWSAEVEGVRNADGSITITGIRINEQPL